MQRQHTSNVSHVVLISLDTLRSDCVDANPTKLWPSRHGAHHELRTGVIDDLARGGAFFTNCIAAAPYTSASHGAFLTGRWPVRNGLYEMFNRKLRAPTLFQRAARLGYRTVLKTDFPLLFGPMLGLSSGVDHYLVEDDAGFLELVDRQQPTVALAHFGGIHSPYGFHNLRLGGAAYVDKVRQLEAELETPLDPAHSRETDLDLSVRYRRSLHELYTLGRYERLFALYVEGINHFLATRFAPFLDRLMARLRGLDHLLVVFGDHGEEFDAESFGHQATLAEGVLRVPLILSGPGVTPGLHRERVRAIDLVPTLMEAMTGRPARPGVFDGSSLLGGHGRDGRAAFAQAYATENRAYLDFVQRAMIRGRKTGSLPHVLLREAVYANGARLERHLHDFVPAADGGWELREIPPRVRLERVEADGLPRREQDAALTADLLRRLDEYNGRRAATEPVDVTDTIRRQLQAMGYRV